MLCDLSPYDSYALISQEQDLVMSVVHKKLVVVGDGGSGKSHLLLTFTNSPIEPFMLKVTGMSAKPYTSDIEVDGQLVRLTMWDTPGLLTISKDDYTIITGIVELV